MLGVNSLYAANSMNMMSLYANAVQIGSFEAKTKFAELLRNVEQGLTYSITRNGKTVAIMQSPEIKKQSEGMKAFSRLDARAQKIRNGSSSLSLSDIEEMKNDGRKY